MPVKSHRQKILEAVTALLEDITVANGYDHNVTVMRGRGRLDDNDLKQLPVVTILEAPKTEGLASPHRGPTRQCAWELFLTGFTAYESAHPTDNPHALLRDVKLALGRTRKESDANYLLGGQLKVVEITVGGGICRPPDDQHITSNIILPLTITFDENLEAP
jgi:hypothetical protein